MKLTVFILSFVFLLLAPPVGWAQSQAPVVAPSASPAPAPQVALVAPDASVVAVPEPAAPPQWASDLIMQAQKFPVIGPIVSKALVYAGIISSVLTALVGFLFAVLSALAGISNLSGLVGLADKLTLFKNGEIMYWLSYLSMFNAKKPEKK